MKTEFPSNFALQRATFTEYPQVTRSSLPSSDMEEAVFYVENVLDYSFKNKGLLEEALTHPSYTESASYQRLEFLGDAALDLALSNYLFLAYPRLEEGQLTLLRSANVSTEKLARVAIKHDFYRFVRRNATSLDDQVREFASAVSEEDNTAVYGGSMEAPDVLAAIVESIAAAIYVDIDFDLQRLWMIFRQLLEPIVTLEDLQQQPQPVTMLFELCQKEGKEVSIKWREKNGKKIASIYVNGKFVASGSSKQKKIAKLIAAGEALDKLSRHMPVNSGKFEIDNAKQKLQELCNKKKWPKPTYKIEKEEGPSHEKIFVSSVWVGIADDVLHVTGDEKSTIKDAENSAASMMIRALQESAYLC